MIRRVIAALSAIILAAVAVVLVVNYANGADARALEGMETDNIYVALEPIAEGTSADSLKREIETRAVPRQFQVNGAVTDLDDLEGLVAISDIAVGEQLKRAGFGTPEEVRASGDFVLPEEAKDMHQLTIPLENPRALGGSIAPGDTVGVFGSFEIQTDGKYVLDPDGNVVPSTDFEDQSQDENGDSSNDGESDDSESDQVDLTDLLLHKALVVRVEGGFVAPPSTQEEGDEAAGPADVIHVTLALEAEDAGRVVYAMEYGKVWLTLEPESASDDEPRTIVITVPSKARNVLE